LDSAEAQWFGSSYILCDLIDADPAQDERNRGLLGTWSRACVLKDGRGIEYRLPASMDRRHEWASSLISAFRENGYHLEFFSFPEQVNAHYFELVALPLTLNAASPGEMDQLILENFQARFRSESFKRSTSVRSYESDDGRTLAIWFVASA
jgi:hypothetical protein